MSRYQWHRRGLPENLIGDLIFMMYIWKNSLLYFLTRVSLFKILRCQVISPRLVTVIYLLMPIKQNISDGHHSCYPLGNFLIMPILLHMSMHHLN